MDFNENEHDYKDALEIETSHLLLGKEEHSCSTARESVLSFSLMSKE